MADLPRKLPIWPGAPSASRPKSHVLQQRGPDCAIAAAATIAGVTYDQAASVAFSLREEGLGGVRPAGHGETPVSSHRRAPGVSSGCFVPGFRCPP